MRHVILGSDTTIGSSIVRLLTSISADSVIAVSTSGILPDGIDPKKAEPKFGDVVDPYSLSDLFKEDDIVYHCQLLTDELASIEDAELYNQIGFVNLLGVATAEKVAKIVCAFPQSLGYKLPVPATEEDLGEHVSPVQKTLRAALHIAQLYYEGLPFGWKQKKIQEFTQSAESTANFEPEEEDDGDLPDDKNTETKDSTPPSGPKHPSTGPPSGPSIKTGPSIGPSTGSSLGPKSSGPSLGSEHSTGPSLGGPKGPSLGTSGPTTSQSGVDESDDAETDDVETKQDIQNSGDEISISEEYEPVPLLIGRLAQLFGPFDTDLTDTFCRSIRLQRMDVVGKLEAPITWINPLDAARALIIMGDPKVDADPGQYLITGFQATPRQILDALDEINHSTITLNHRSLFLERLKHYLKLPALLLGLKIHDPYFEYLRLNRTQVFDDSKATEEFQWDPKFDLEQTVKDAMNWFNSHQL